MAQVRGRAVAGGRFAICSEGRCFLRGGKPILLILAHHVLEVAGTCRERLPDRRDSQRAKGFGTLLLSQWQEAYMWHMILPVYDPVPVDSAICKSMVWPWLPAAVDLRYHEV
jgi:hypothetical protein